MRALHHMSRLVKPKAKRDRRDPILAVRLPAEDRKRLELIQIRRGDEFLSETARLAIRDFIRREERKAA